MFFWCVSSVLTEIGSEKVKEHREQREFQDKVKTLQRATVLLKEEKPQPLEDVTNVGIFISLL